MTLQQQTAAANDGVFIDMVRAAMVQTALNIYSEATTLKAPIKSGTTTPSLQLSVALGVAIAAGAVIRVGGELLVVAAAGAAAGATSIPCSTTTTMDHLTGEAISPPTVANHLPRASYARTVLNDPETYKTKFAAAAATANLTNQSLDSDLLNQCSADWNALAGA